MAGASGFVRESDPYIRSCGPAPECSFPDPIKIPAGYWFMMGDNRGASDDSRFWGPVPTAWIVGTGSRVSSQDNANIDPMTSKGPNPSSDPLLPRWRGWLIVIPGIYAGGFVASVLYGAPAKLPGVALGFPALLHLERAGAVLAAVSVVSTFAYMTSLGHLPSQFGNVIGYSVADRQHELEGSIAELGRRTERRLIPLEEGKRADNEALPVIAGQLTALDRRVDAVEARLTR